MKLKAKSIEDCYPVFVLNYPINKVSIREHIEFLVSLFAVKYKNKWFNSSVWNKNTKRNFNHKIKFKLNQFIIHKVFGKYSFSKYVVLPEKELLELLRQKQSTTQHGE